MHLEEMALEGDGIMSRWQQGLISGAKMERAAAAAFVPCLWGFPERLVGHYVDTESWTRRTFFGLSQHPASRFGNAFMKSVRPRGVVRGCQRAEGRSKWHEA